MSRSDESRWCTYFIILDTGLRLFRAAVCWPMHLHLTYIFRFVFFFIFFLFHVFQFHFICATKSCKIRSTLAPSLMHFHFLRQLISQSQMSRMNNFIIMQYSLVWLDFCFAHSWNLFNLIIFNTRKHLSFFFMNLQFT